MIEKLMNIYEVFEILDNGFKIIVGSVEDLKDPGREK
jgi:hypothetical protein